MFRLFSLKASLFLLPHIKHTLQAFDTHEQDGVFSIIALNDIFHTFVIIKAA
jgi:hypothetical protein